MSLKTKALTYIMNKLEPDNLVDPNAKTSTAMAPATNEQIATMPETAKDAEVVSGTFVPDIQINTAKGSDALAHTERIRKTVESFNDDRMVGLEWVIVHFFKGLAYLLPPFIAWIVGCAIGQAFSGKFD